MEEQGQVSNSFHETSHTFVPKTQTLPKKKQKAENKIYRLFFLMTQKSLNKLQTLYYKINNHYIIKNYK